MSEKWRGKDSIQISTPQAKSSLYIILISLLDHRELAADLPPNWCRTIILTEQIWRDVMVDSSSDSWILDGTSRQNSLPPLEMFCKYENKIWTIYTQLTTDLILHCELNRSTAHWLTISQMASVQQVLFQFNPGKPRQKHGDLVPGLFHCLGTLWRESTTSVLQKWVG